MDNDIYPLLLEIAYSHNLINLNDVFLNNNINVEILNLWEPNNVKLNKIQVRNNRAE